MCVMKFYFKLHLNKLQHAKYAKALFERQQSSSPVEFPSRASFLLGTHDALHHPVKLQPKVVLLLPRSLGLVHTVVAEHTMRIVGEMLCLVQQLYPTNVAKVCPSSIAASYRATCHVVASEGSRARRIAFWTSQPTLAGHEFFKGIIHFFVILPPLPVRSARDTKVSFLALEAHLLLAGWTGHKALFGCRRNDDDFTAGALDFSLTRGIGPVELCSGGQESIPKLGTLKDPHDLEFADGTSALGHWTNELLL
mmetsp:Transcript_38102/g.77884  ORF Transcript_38102/g.77884 Transcript_38102/m.77884 type:complete len:252 (+) Transcript_38102:66-821(+)